MRVVGILILITAFVLLVTGQDKEIIREDFYKPYREALTKANTLRRRMVQQIKTNVSGSWHEEEWIYEYQPPDRVRFVQIDSFGGQPRRIEQIDIGKTKYCKKDNGEWTITTSYCIGGSGSGGPSNILNEKYSKVKADLSGKRVTLYRQSITYKNIYSKTAETDGPSFWETKYWIDDSGLLLHYESRRGLVSNLIASYELIETYEYGSGISVEPPIKSQ